MSSPAVAAASAANTARASGNAEATSGSNPQDGAPPENPNDPSNNRFLSDLNKAKNEAAFGVYVPDIIKAQSGGKTDYNREIQLSIRREFFTMKQYLVGIYWAMTIGMVIGALTLALLTPNGFPDVFGENALMIWGVFLLSFGMSTMLSDFESHGRIRKCTTKKWDNDDPSGKKTYKKGDFKVEEGYRGMECMSDWDCTRKSSVTGGVCSLPERNALFKFQQKVIAPILVVVGAIMTTITFSSTDFRLAKKDLAQSVIYGIGFGTILAIAF